MVSLLISVSACVLALSAVGLSLYLVQVIQEEKSRPPQRYGSSSRRRKRSRSRQTRPQFSPLQQRMMTLLAGDWSAVERLVTGVRQRHPGRSETWYWEKVIHDLERDRR